MRKAGSGQRRRSSVEAPPRPDTHGNGGPEEAAAFIAETSAELSKIAKRHGLETLRHLLDMTELDAVEWLRNRRRLS